MGLFATGAGVLAGAGGAFLGAKSARQKKNALNAVADTPGLDTGALGREALSGNLANFGLGSDLTSKINRFNQSENQALLDDSIPGYSARKDKTYSILDSWLRGEVPQDVQDQLFNSAAGRSLSGGYGGSGMARNLSARDLGLTSLGLQQQGLTGTMGLNRETAGLEMPDIANVANYLGITPRELVAIRGNERTQRMGLQAQVAGMPNGKDIWAKYLTDQGGALEGGGLSTIGSPGFTSFSGISGGSNKQPIYMSGYGG